MTAGLVAGALLVLALGVAAGVHLLMWLGLGLLLAAAVAHLRRLP